MRSYMVLVKGSSRPVLCRISRTAIIIHPLNCINWLIKIREKLRDTKVDICKGKLRYRNYKAENLKKMENVKILMCII